MEVIGVLVIILLSAITIFVSTLFAVGFVQGINEPANIEGLCSGGNSLPENRIQHINCWGTWDGYTIEDDGVLHHYDSFGKKTGTSHRM